MPHAGMALSTYGHYLISAPHQPLCETGYDHPARFPGMSHLSPHLASSLKAWICCSVAAWSTHFLPTLAHHAGWSNEGRIGESLGLQPSPWASFENNWSSAINLNEKAGSEMWCVCLSEGDREPGAGWPRLECELRVLLFGGNPGSPSPHLCNLSRDA